MDDPYFMRFALAQARQALAAGEFPVGCIMVHRGRIVVSGARSGTRSHHPNEIDHAEMVALRRLDTMGESFPHGELVLYCTMEPCLMCFAALTLSRIGKVVYAYEDVMGGGTGCDLTSLPPLYDSLKPEIVGGVLRGESLALFQAFFSNEAHAYWQGSLLADYTLAQQGC